MSDREFMLSVYSMWGNEGFLRCNLSSDVQERIKKKAFIDLFNDNYQNIYDEAYDTIMENILMSDIIWNGRKVDEFHYLRKIDRQFSIALKVEMYLFQEVGKPELGFPNHEFIQLCARTSARSKSMGAGASTPPF